MVDLEDPVHPGEGDRQPAVDAGGSPAEPGPGAARDDRDPVAGGEPDELGDLGGPARQGDGDRERWLEVGRLVAPVGLPVERVGQESQLGEGRANGGEERRLDGRGGG